MIRKLLSICVFVFAGTFVQAQDRTVSGKVTSSEDGSALPGANVVLKGTSNGTVTNADGRYSLVVSTGQEILLFSSIGFETQEILVGEKTTIDVVMALDAEVLSEIVVVGYGTQEKANLTGAIGVAKGDVLKNRPIANVGEGLQGVIPNLNVDIRNGDPAEPAQFNIRGFTSINGGQPLILVDGVPMDLNQLNPNDIESVSVLKDAAASAVYGARAAFGVVLVKTKKGAGKISVSAGVETAISKPIFLIDPVTDPYQFVLARNKALTRAGSAPYDQDYMDGTQAYSENPTFENAWGVYNGTLRFYGYNDYSNRLITDFAPQTKYDASVSGSTEKSSFYVSFGALSKDGYLKNDAKNEKFKRYNILMKGEFKITDWLSVDSRALLTTEDSDKPHFYNWDVNINTTARVDPLNPISFPDLPYYLTPGDHDDYAQYQGMHFSSVNFLPYLEQGGRDTWTKNNIVLTQGMTLTPIKGLNIRGEFSANMIYRDYQEVGSKINVIENSDLANLIIGNGLSGTDYIYNRANNSQYYVINTYADYTIKRGSHDIKAMVGFNQEWGKYQQIGARAFSLITPLVPDLDATTGSQVTTGGKEDVALRGAFFRLNYNFNDRYLVEVNGRYDGTSRFPKSDRFGFFPSFSAGWRISEEGFMSGTSSWLSNLKLRASYGSLGNQLLFDNSNNPPTPIYYPYIPTLGSSPSSYMMAAGGRIPTVSAAGLVGPTLTWETVTSQNIGLDFGLFNGKLEVSADVYTRDTKDMLTEATYPDLLGTNAPKENAADLRTRGWEVAATWQSKIKSDWNYSITLALSDNRAEITKYDNPSGAFGKRYVGQVIGETWGFETAGIFQTDDEVTNSPSQSALATSGWKAGDMKYADLDGDGTINYGTSTLDDPGDQRIIAYQSPRGNYGITGNVGWKNFYFSIFFQGVLKYDFLPDNSNWNAFYPFNAGHVENYYLTETWSPENPNAYFAAPHISTNEKKNILPQSRYVQNGAYGRIKNLSFGYNLSPQIANKIGLNGVQIYFSGQNLGEITSMHRPLDPEVRPTLTQEYYKQRTYALGLRVTL